MVPLKEVIAMRKWTAYGVALLTMGLMIVVSAGSQAPGPVIDPTVIEPCWNLDGPGCTCFDNYDSWNPAGGFFIRPQYIQDIAARTVGTADSCLAAGGQPYYQFQLGCNSRDAARDTARIIDTGLITGVFPARSGWCSEAVSYWHREAGIPYAGGYRDGVTQLHWRLPGTKVLKRYYQAQELMPDGRGVWINHNDLDYDNPVLGETIPVPGAYVRIAPWDPATGHFTDETEARHSMMIDEMTIYRTSSGRIVRIEASILEGNVTVLGIPEPVVSNAARIDDLFSVTPAGAATIGELKKIWGFGIDCTYEGVNRIPIYDPNRLHYVLVPEGTPPPPVVEPDLANKTAPPVFDWVQDPLNPDQDPLVDALVDYAWSVDAAGGIAIDVTGPTKELLGIPDGVTTQWVFPSGGAAPITVVIDLIDVHPLPITGIALTWDGEPPGMGHTVQWAGADGKYRQAAPPIQQQGNLALDYVPATPTEWPAGIPIPFVFDPEGARVRYVKFIIPAQQGQALVLDELTFAYDWGPDDDAPENFLEETVGIVVLESQAVAVAAAAK